ncbi:MAG: hypothetical protein DRQ02_00590 [Candidatus Latescibacterota bacterium]|nr:MAG: hypothetical protein DRQ02_00590 [Candidatus Latescibacterota bacterium]RKY73625.1 MAG: hypothetical protein DRQ24_02040 [Candidatus Latescibacterota bacterium]
MLTKNRHFPNRTQRSCQPIPTYSFSERQELSTLKNHLRILTFAVTSDLIAQFIPSRLADRICQLLFYPCFQININSGYPNVNPEISILKEPVTLIRQDTGP